MTPSLLLLLLTSKSSGTSAFKRAARPVKSDSGEAKDRSRSFSVSWVAAPPAKNLSASSFGVLPSPTADDDEVKSDSGEENEMIVSGVSKLLYCVPVIVGLMGAEVKSLSREEKEKLGEEVRLSTSVVLLVEESGLLSVKSLSGDAKDSVVPVSFGILVLYKPCLDFIIRLKRIKPFKGY